MGVILYLADKYSKSDTDYENITLKKSLTIGFSQSLAFIPGVSRSGVTTTTGRLLGIDRESAARFSFMLAAPIILGATIFKLKDFSVGIEQSGALEFFIGILTSFVLGMLVIKFLLEYLKKGSLKVFAIYRVVIGIVIIAITLI